MKTKALPLILDAEQIRAVLRGASKLRRLVEPQGSYVRPELMPDEVTTAWLTDVRHRYGSTRILHSPFGAAGQALWIKETFALEHAVTGDQPLPHDDGRPVQRAPADDVDGVHPAWIQPHYRATDPAPALAYVASDEPQVKWRPSAQMPRWASRLTLETVDVSVRRFNDWTEDEALAEGVETIGGRFTWNGGKHESRDPLVCSRAWFEARYGLGSTDTNPWVWVLSHRRSNLSA